MKKLYGRENQRKGRMKQMVSEREMVIKKLKERGCRITKQRLMLLDVILGEECSSCKEIFYKASKIDKGIGTATIYRMINTLEEIGAINRKNMYKIACGNACSVENACVIEFEDATALELSAEKWHSVIREGLRACGLSGERSIRSVSVATCSCDRT